MHRSRYGEEVKRWHRAVLGQGANLKGRGVGELHLGHAGSDWQWRGLVHPNRGGDRPL